MRKRMDWRSVKFDWNRARAFLVTAEEGSLSAAARALGMAQPTLGRQVRALEDELGVVLFERIGRSLSLTPSGLELVDHVRSMGEAATRFSLTASGQSQSIEGKVTITATEIAAAFALPTMIRELRRAEPGIAIEIIASNSISDLRRREADIAIRGLRPTDPDLIAQKVREDTAYPYAADSYIAEKGGFATPEELSRADFIGFEDNKPFRDGLQAMGLSVTRDNFPVTCETHLVQWELLKEGLGIVFMPRFIGDREPGISRVAPWLPPFEFEIWLVAHRELNTSRRIRLVFDWLVDAWKKL
ncbi:MAG: LysR family transcriptional regulator [Pseudomonadota bacterium]